MCFEVDALGFELLALGLGGGVEGVEVIEDERFHVIAQFWRQRDRAVLLFNELFNQAQAHCLALAGCRASLPARAG
ncbi:hypothetical protein HWD35_18920 [Tsukamurella tyrosinosolvens]|uniref:hypothetical protein n=1 Tax=Tsukamurella tyrosinosolvens TaxID=57704 RepID=UPI001CE11362|nr:hypothetical protein [Tsukamurella tyrosinosolvens]MCA4996793.1 hypothetical protein [Tsukamurella tyrosinosolvens]